MRDTTSKGGANILIVNAHSSINAGDNVLLEVAAEQLRRLFPGCTLTVAMNDPGPVAGAAVVGSFVTWLRRPAPDDRWRKGALALAPLTLLRLRRALRAARDGRPGGQGFAAPQRALLDAYRNADLVVGCPGGYIFSSGRVGLPLMLALLAMTAAIWAGKPLYVLPHSIGPLRRRWEFAWVDWLVQRTRVSLLRDRESLALLRLRAGCYSHVAQAPDLALLYRGDNPDAGRRVLAQAGVDADAPGPRLGMTLMNWGAQNRHFGAQADYEVAMAAAARRFVEQFGGTVVIFPQVTGPSWPDDDRVPARRVRAQLADLGGRVVVLEDAVAPRALKSAYGLMTIFLGTRLHSNLFALTAGTPVVAVAYRPKTRGVLEMAGLGAWVIDIEEARGDALAQLVSAAWAQNDALREHLGSVLGGLELDATRALQTIRADYDYLVEARASVGVAAT